MIISNPGIGAWLAINKPGHMAEDNGSGPWFDWPDPWGRVPTAADMAEALIQITQPARAQQAANAQADQNIRTYLANNPNLDPAMVAVLQLAQSIYQQRTSGG